MFGHLFLALNETNFTSAWWRMIAAQQSLQTLVSQYVTTYELDPYTETGPPETDLVCDTGCHPAVS